MELLDSEDSNEQDLEQEETLDEKELLEEDEFNKESSTNINNSGDNSVTIEKSIVETLNQFNVNLENESTNTSFPCPDCHALLDASKYGKIICTGCGKVLFRRNPKLDISEFETIDDKETKEYKKIISHINNKLKDRKFIEAYNYCLKAEEIAPAESTTWEYFALTEFLLEINKKDRNQRKTTHEIIKIIKNHLYKCKDYGISDSRYEELSGDIANKLFYYERSRLNSIRPFFKDSNGNEVWLKKYLLFSVTFLKSYELCFSLYEDERYLEEYVKELSKPYKWIVKDSEGVFKNMPSCGNYPAVSIREKLINKIKEYQGDYYPPEIMEERFTIIEDRDNDDGIDIISIE